MTGLEKNKQRENVNEKKAKNKSYKKGSYICFAIVLGVIFGLLIDNLAVGIGSGVVIAIPIDAKKIKEQKLRDKNIRKNNESSEHNL